LVAAGFIQTREVLRSLGEGQSPAARGPHGSFGQSSPKLFYRMRQLAPRHGPQHAPPAPHISPTPTTPAPRLNQSPSATRAAKSRGAATFHLGKAQQSPPQQCQAQSPAGRGCGGGRVGRFRCTSITMSHVPARAGSWDHPGHGPEPAAPSCWEDPAVPTLPAADGAGEMPAGWTPDQGSTAQRMLSPSTWELRAAEGSSHGPSGSKRAAGRVGWARTERGGREGCLHS